MKLTKDQEIRRQEYREIVDRIGGFQTTLAEHLGVRRECISKRCTGFQIVTTEALLALKQVAREIKQTKDECDDLF